MSNYGPPGGPHPGQPREPWHGRGQHEPYEQPPQQWAGQDPWDASRYAQPAYGGCEPTLYYERPYPSGGFEPGGLPPGGLEPAWAEPASPAAAPDGRGGRTQILVLVVVLVLLVCGGGGTALYLLGRGEEPTPTQASPRATSPTPSQAAPSSVAKASSPAVQSSTDARFVKVGQCVKNAGAPTKPRLVITRCGAKTYQVLARIDGATTGERDAKAKCGKVAGYTDWYFFNSELDVLDFVLCLKQR